MTVSFAIMAWFIAGLAFIFLLVSFLHYLGWRGYDREFGTEYRFKEGSMKGFDNFPFTIPFWMERLLRKFEALGWL